MAERKPTDKQVTYEKFLAVPPHRVGEIIEGELYVSPRPAAPHAIAASALTGALHPPFSRGKGGPGGWWILIEPELHLADDIAVPDVAGWRRERLGSLADVTAFSVVPDWVCEVVSPASARHDRIRKSRLYALRGVPAMWIVDPIARTLEVFRLAGAFWQLQQTFAGDELIRAEPFDAIELELGALWLPEASSSGPGTP